ncbi:hypothetical protein PVAP13_4NG244711 [Panicum virgatum]|uniref:Uncharacterized protein n=1 Tax=Panicum virgatum TaxID=38727 RepID=A0A8T0TEC7_PANVG|nr:hypothetical protein PVAP13_4NG244711 [Panicum virgatum]
MLRLLPFPSPPSPSPSPSPAKIMTHSLMQSPSAARRATKARAAATSGGGGTLSARRASRQSPPPFSPARSTLSVSPRVMSPPSFFPPLFPSQIYLFFPGAFFSLVVDIPSWGLGGDVIRSGAPDLGGASGCERKGAAFSELHLHETSLSTFTLSFPAYLLLRSQQHQPGLLKGACLPAREKEEEGASPSSSPLRLRVRLFSAPVPPAGHLRRPSSAPGS